MTTVSLQPAHGSVPWRSIVLGGAFVAIVVSVPSDQTLGWVILMLGGIAVAVIGALHPGVRLPLTAAFVCRAVLTLIQTYVHPLPSSGIDAVEFDAAAWMMANHPSGSLPSVPTSGGRLYSWTIAVLYVLGGGRGVLIPQAVNVVFGSLVVLNVWAAARRLWNDRAAVRAAWLMALFPSSVLFSAIMLREVAVVFPLSLGAYFLVRWRQSRSVAPFVGALMCFAAATLFHSGSVAAIVALFLLVARDSWSATWRGSATGIVRAAAVLVPLIVLALVLYRTGFGLDKFLRHGALEDLSAETLGRAQGFNTAGRASYLHGLFIRTPADLIWQSPIRVVYFLFTPFPWMVSAFGDLVGLLDALFFVWFAALIVRHRRTVGSRDAARSLLMVTAVAVVLFAIPVSNWGTGLRHRGKLVPIIAIVAAAAWQGRVPRTGAPIRLPSHPVPG
jgi:4-amino-4-deoxy-L-arabinose transferase-like glycosyltransferase